MNSLRHFVTELYQQPGIETQCLAWQDRYGADVPLLLFICWYSVRYGRLPLSTLQKLIQESRALASGVVEPLRDIRRQMKAQDVPASRYPVWQRLREQVKHTELQAEFEILKHLSDTAAPGTMQPPTLAEVRHLLELNLRDWHDSDPLRAGNQPPSQERIDFTALITAALRLASASPGQGRDQTGPASAQHDDR